MSLLKEVDCKLIIKSKNTFPGVEDLKDSPPTTGRLGFPKAVGGGAEACQNGHCWAKEGGGEGEPWRQRGAGSVSLGIVVCRR